jgi:tetratricopeptide (TPR) repeat protein
MGSGEPAAAGMEGIMESSTATVIRWEAQRLAASGRRDAALALLLQARDASLAAAALRAKILCQQGRFDEGAASWRELLAAAPDDDEARRGLALSERLAKSPFGAARLRWRQWTLAVLFAGGVGLLAWRTVGGSSAPAFASLERAVVESNASTRASADRLDTRLADVARALAGLEKRIDESRIATSSLTDGMARLEGALTDQRGAMARADEELRTELRRTQEQLRTTNARTVRSLRALEARLQAAPSR